MVYKNRMFTLGQREERFNKLEKVINECHFLDGEDPSKPFYADPSTFKGNMDDFRVEIHSNFIKMNFLKCNICDTQWLEPLGANCPQCDRSRLKEDHFKISSELLGAIAEKSLLQGQIDKLKEQLNGTKIELRRF